MADGLTVKTAVMISVSNFPMSSELLERWAAIADHICVWFDLPYSLGGNGDPDIKQQCLDVLDRISISRHTIQSHERWNLTNYRESLLRSLDGIRPEIVLQPDSDECFDVYFQDELERFRNRPELLLYMDYTMVTVPGFSTYKTPPKPHCKAFKWMPDMSFVIRYQGRATPRYHGITPTPRWDVNACTAVKSRMRHYVHYNRQLRDHHLEQKRQRRRRGLT